MSRIGVGVVGRGVWGCHSLEQELRKLPGVEVVAVTAGPQWGVSCFDDQVAAGRRYAAELGADYREDWREVVEAPDVDVVSLMTSPATRREPALAAFAAGKHVVVDKPLAHLASDDGMLGTVRCGRVPYETWEEPFSVDVIGSQGGASVRANRTVLSPSGEEFTDPSPKAALLERSFEAFLDAIEGRGQPATTFEDGLLITRILDAAYRSARDTRAIAIER